MAKGQKYLQSCLPSIRKQIPCVCFIYSIKISTLENYKDITHQLHSNE